MEKERRTMALRQNPWVLEDLLCSKRISHMVLKRFFFLLHFWKRVTVGLDMDCS